MKRLRISALIGIGAGALLLVLWWVLAVSGLVPVLFVDGAFFTGIVLCLVALLILTKPGPAQNTTAGAYQSHNFGAHAVFGLKLKIEKGNERRERRGPTSKEVGSVLLLAGLMCFGPYVVSLFL